MNRKALGSIGVGGALALLLCLLAIPMVVIGGTSMLFAGSGGLGCTPGANQSVAQPGVSTEAANSIPSNYLTWYRKVGQQYGIPWTVLAGIGKVESDHGRTTLPGVHSGANAFGAAGPMQIGIEGAAGNAWATFATVEDGKTPASVYDPADAIAGAAKYLIAHGAPERRVGGDLRVQPRELVRRRRSCRWASTYASGGFTVSAVSPGGVRRLRLVRLVHRHRDSSTPSSPRPPRWRTAISFAQQQLGKPYLWGGTGPDAFDCSGLVMMAYRAAGIFIARTSEAQWATLPHVPATQVEPGDLVFFAGSDGTPTSPGHVGLVIGKNKMIEAYATGFPIRISTFGTPTSAGGLAAVVGYARPWGHT